MSPWNVLTGSPTICLPVLRKQQINPHGDPLGPHIGHYPSKKPQELGRGKEEGGGQDWEERHHSQNRNGFGSLRLLAVEGQGGGRRGGDAGYLQMTHGLHLGAESKSWGPEQKWLHICWQ